MHEAQNQLRFIMLVVGGMTLSFSFLEGKWAGREQSRLLFYGYVRGVHHVRVHAQWSIQELSDRRLAN